jgi:hypothetical protein
MLKEEQAKAMIPRFFLGGGRRAARNEELAVAFCGPRSERRARGVTSVCLRSRRSETIGAKNPEARRRYFANAFVTAFSP